LSLGDITYLVPFPLGSSVFGTAGYFDIPGSTCPLHRLADSLLSKIKFKQTARSPRRRKMQSKSEPIKNEANICYLLFSKQSESSNPNSIMLMKSSKPAEITDPNGTDYFNKTLIRKYMLQRAAKQDKKPIIIDAISDTQRIELHGEQLLTSAVSVQGDGLAQHYTIYFANKPSSNGSYLSGGRDLLEEIDKDGFDAESDKIHESQNKDAATEASPTPEGSE
jgi:hypothetical protein